MKRTPRGRIKRPAMVRRFLKASEQAYDYITFIAVAQKKDRIVVLDQIVDAHRMATVKNAG